MRKEDKYKKLLDRRDLVKEFLDGRSEWCIPELPSLEPFKYMRVIREGATTSSYRVEESSGRHVMITVLNIERLLNRCLINARLQGIPEDQIVDEMSKRFGAVENAFMQAGQRVIGLGSDNVCFVYDVQHDAVYHTPVIVSEYAPGVNLGFAAKFYDPMQMISIMVQYLEALNYIHTAGYLHLNIKPKRIHVDIECHPPVVKILDFGFAIPLSGYDGEYSGTARYMAPEVINQQRELIDVRADIYSSGIMFYAVLAGFYPTEKRQDAEGNREKLVEAVSKEGIFPPPSNYNKLVPKELDNILMSMAHKDPEKRPKTVQDTLSIVYNKWPKESKEMPEAQTYTTTMVY